MKHLLVTNDFPPKVGGIQSYLWELWRRLPPADTTVLTTPHPDAAEFDRAQAFVIHRTKQWWLLPTKRLADQINALADEVGADLIVLDPAFPLSGLARRLHRPYVVIVHGAEYVIPAKLWITRPLLRRITANAAGVIAGGEYVAAAARALTPARRSVPVTSIPPGVDVQRFVPATDKATLKAAFGVGADELLVVGVSRLVPRKGFDRLVNAAGVLVSEVPNLRVLIAGKGREQRRLRRLIERSQAPVELLGRVPDEQLESLYSAADLFCMPCHDRWFGLEREGFGIVFVEAAAAGVPSVAGASGGSGEAVDDGATGLVLPGKASIRAVTEALEKLLMQPERMNAMGEAARRRAEAQFDYDLLAQRLAVFLDAVGRSDSQGRATLGASEAFGEG